MTRRAMFVSTDQSQLAVVRRLFEPLQREWALDATADARGALARLDEAPTGVVVSDVRVTGLTAEEFLTEVRRRHPQAVRIALVSPAEHGEALRLVSLAHRALTKPLEAEALLSAVQRSQSLRELLLSPSLTAVIGRIGSLPALSALYARIAEELAYPDFSMAEVGELVEQDIAIAAKLIQMANSALLGLRRPAGTPSQAVRVLGADLTRTLVLAADLFSRYDPAALRPFSIDALWEHSRRTAELASQIAQSERAGERIVREAALAGLFHDIGRLAIASQLPGPYKEVLEIMRTERLPAAEAERQVLGASHAEIGGYLLGIWGLPDGLVEAVAWHHSPSGCPGSTFSALTAVHVAEALMRGDEKSQLDLEYLTRLGLDHRLEHWAGVVGDAQRSRPAGSDRSVHLV